MKKIAQKAKNGTKGQKSTKNRPGIQELTQKPNIDPKAQKIKPNDKNRPKSQKSFHNPKMEPKARNRQKIDPVARN